MFLNISALKVQYADRLQAAVADVSLSLRASEIGVLIGPSGCGKTTLLRAVAGLEQAQSGSIALSGQTVSSATVHLPPEQRRVGMVFQDYALFPHMDVRHNVGFGIHHLPHPERKARDREVLQLVGLEGTEARFSA